MDIAVEILKDTFSTRRHGNPRSFFQKLAEMFVALHLLIVADRIEGAEQARMLRRD
jgi:EAL domain-containing protein (putative c-di-GMP-specific phosphodiesterase class I)